MIEVYGKQNCGFCTQAITLLESNGIEYRKFIIDENISRDEFVSRFPDVRTVPLIYLDGNRLGGYQQLKEYVEARTNMILNTEQIVKALKKHVVLVSYTTSTGNATVRCTLAPSFLPVQKDIEELATPDGAVLVWDIDHSMWVRLNAGAVFGFLPEV